MAQDRSMPAPNSSRPDFRTRLLSRRCVACYRPAAASHVAIDLGGEREQEVAELVLKGTTLCVAPWMNSESRGRIAASAVLTPCGTPETRS